MAENQSWIQLGTGWSARRIALFAAAGFLTMLGGASLEPAAWQQVWWLVKLAAYLFGSLAFSGLILLMFSGRRLTPFNWYQVTAEACRTIDQQFGTRHFIPGVLLGCLAACFPFFWATAMIHVMIGALT